MLSLLARRAATKVERVRMEVFREQLDAGLAYGRDTLAALGAQVAGALLMVGRVRDARVRARAGATLAGWLILGGVLAVPVAAICAAIGALLPSSALVHQHAGDAFAFATIWFIAALLAAQFQRRRRHDEPAAD